MVPKVFRAIAILIAAAMRASGVIQKAGRIAARAKTVALILDAEALDASIIPNGERTGVDGVDSIAGTFSSFGAEVPDASRLSD